MSRNFIFEITQKCNYNCEYCYNGTTAKEMSELSIKQIDQVLKNIFAEEKIDSITLAGGEPVLHPELSKIAELINRYSNGKTKIALATNGSILTENKLKQLTKAGIRYFELSIDSLNNNTYQSICGTDTDIHTIRKTLHLLKEKRCTVLVSIMLTSQNLADIETVVKYGILSNADGILLNRFIEPACGIQSESIQLSKEQHIKLLSKINSIAKTSLTPIFYPCPIESCFLNPLDFPNIKFGVCACGDQKWYINASGKLRTCEQNPEIIGDLLSEPFTKLKDSAKAQIFREQNLYPECTSCTTAATCSGGCKFANR